MLNVSIFIYILFEHKNDERAVNRDTLLARYFVSLKFIKLWISIAEGLFDKSEIIRRSRFSITAWE